MQSEDPEWRLSLCSRLLVVLCYATSVIAVCRDLRRLLCLPARGRSADSPGSSSSDGGHGHCSHCDCCCCCLGASQAEQIDVASAEEQESLLQKGSSGAAADGKQYYSQQHAAGLSLSPAAAAAAALREEGRSMSKAFVTFHSLSAATIARQVPLPLALPATVLPAPLGPVFHMACLVPEGPIPSSRLPVLLPGLLRG